MFGNFMRKGFTLSEVLITLSIIGIIATLTIPPLIQNEQKQAFVAGLQKSYSTLSAGFLQMMVDENVDNFADVPMFQDAQTNYGNSTLVRDTMKKYFKITKACEQFECNAVPQYTTLGNDFSMRPDSMNFYIFYTLDGMILYLDNCSTCSVGGWNIYVDVNGAKKPNILGRDVFTFYVNAKGILHPLADKPFADAGGSDDLYWAAPGPMSGAFCGTPGDSGAGKGVFKCAYCTGCAARIIENGWKMDY